MLFALLVLDTDPRQNSVLFSFGIAKQSTRREEILKFLASGSCEVERDGLDESLVSDLLGLQPVTIDMYQEPHAAEYVSCYNADSQPSLIYQSSDFYSQKPLLGLTRNSAQGPELTLHLDGQVSFTRTGTEMKDVLSIIPEFYLSKNSTTWGKRSMVVPYFERYVRIPLLMYISTYNYECWTWTFFTFNSYGKDENWTC